MAAYILLNAAAPFFTPNTIVPVLTDGPIPQVMVAPEQTFQLTVSGTGPVSATAQVVVSNDRINWFPYGDPVTASGTTKATTGWGGAQNWEAYSAYLTALSGTGAQARLVMNG